jgi:Subtilisin inhibitor-like
VLRITLLLAVAVVASACTRLTDDEPAAPATDLEISVWRAGSDGPVRMWTLSCPDGGTQPEPQKACERLADLGDEAFAPVPDGVGCTQIYGGPQVAEVRGTFQGEQVQARFNRTNGCEIQRWDRVAFLFPTR